jgi:hypothetical protein
MFRAPFRREPAQPNIRFRRADPSRAELRLSAIRRLRERIASVVAPPGRQFPSAVAEEADAAATIGTTLRPRLMNP